MAFVAVAMMFAVCFIGFTVVGDEGADAKMAAEAEATPIGGVTADATVLLTIDTTDITNTTTDAVCGVTVTVSGNDVTVTGTLEASKKMVVKGTASTNVVFNNFLQGADSTVEFTTSGEENTTDPAKAVAHVSFGNNVDLTAVPYVIKDVTTKYVYTGNSIKPVGFPGIETKEGYSVTKMSIVKGGGVGSAGDDIKSQTDVGTYVLRYSVTFAHGSDPLATYEIERSWSITPLEVNITIDGDKVTKTYDGNTTLDKSKITSGSELITIVSADASSKDVSAKDIKLAVSSGDAKITNFTLKYGDKVLEPTKVTNGYEVTLASAVTIEPKSITGFGASQKDLTYNGEEQEVSFSVTGDGFTLSKDDYDLGGEVKKTNAGTYTATVTGKGNFTGTIDNASWTIGPKSLKADGITAEPGSLTYNKSEQTVTITVKDGDKTLNLTTDYTVTGNAETDAGTYTATITGTGNYKDEKTVTWTIASKPLAESMIAPDGTLTYKGSEQKANIKVADDGTDLTEDTDYSFDGVYKATDAGTYNAKIIGKGNYTGTIEKEWIIDPKEIGISWKTTDSDYSVKDKSWAVWSNPKSIYDGTDQKWRVTAEATGTVNEEKVTLSVSLKDKGEMVSAGTYTFTAAFDGEFKNYKLPSTVDSGTYTIEQKELKADYIDYYLIRAADGKYYAQITVSDGSISPAKFSSTNNDGTKTYENNRIEITKTGDHNVKVTVNDSNWKGTNVEKTLQVKFEFTVDFYAYDGSLDLLEKPDFEKMTPEYYYRYLEEHFAYLGFKTVSAGDTVALPAVPAVEGKEFIGWKSYAISTEWEGKEYYTPTYGYYEPKENVRLVAVYDDVKSAGVIGAGFYQDADQAKLAMQALGSTYSLGVSENTMFVVYEQIGYSGSAMKGVVTYNGETIFRENLLSDDGIRTWLFSDANQVTTKFVNNGKYTMSVYKDDDEEALFSVDVYVTIKDPTGHYTVSFADKDGNTFSSKTVTEGDSVALPTAPSVDGMVFKGWKINGDIVATYGYYTPAADVTLIAVYENAAVPECYEVTLEGEGVAFYLDGLRIPAGTYALFEGEHVLIAEPLPGFVGIPEISENVKDGIFTVDEEMTIEVTGVEKTDLPVYKVTLEGYGVAAVTAGESITLPTVSKSGMTFLGWSAEMDAKSGTQGFYTPEKDVTLYAVFAAAESYTVSTDYNGEDVTLAYNSSIAKGSFGLLVVTAKDKVVYDVTATGASLAALGDGSYMIFNVTGNVVISVTTETLKPTGFQTFSVVGALADNKGFRVEMTSVDKGGLYDGNVALTYTYCKVVEGKNTYFTAVSDPVAVTEGDVAWRRDYNAPEEGTMYYAYAVYTYADGAGQSLTAQTLGVLAPSIPAAVTES